MMAITSNGVSQSKHLARHHIKITCTRLMHQRVGPALHHLSVRGLPTTIYPHTIRSVIINVQRSPTGELPSHRHEFSRPQWFNPNIDSSPVGTSSQTIYGYTSGTTRQYAAVTYYVGGDNVHNNQQPFVTVLYYRRIS